jgi:hypothetical protein
LHQANVLLQIITISASIVFFTTFDATHPSSNCGFGLGTNNVQEKHQNQEKKKLQFYQLFLHNNYNGFHQHYHKILKEAMLQV